LLASRDNEDELLKQMSRMGIPPALKCAVWISSVVKSCNPHQPTEYSQDYRTLNKIRQIDHAWETVLKQLFPNPNDEQVQVNSSNIAAAAAAPTFGNTTFRDYIGGPLPDYGEKSLQRVLLAIHYVVGLEYAPLIPTLAIVSLSFMSESYAYSMVREMAHNSTQYFPTSFVEHTAWCRAFMDVLQRLHPQTATCLKTCHVEGSHNNYEGLDPIFKLFFLPILKFVHVLRIMDIYVLEGSKVIFRFGVALLCMFKKDWKVCTVHAPRW
jgi:Rab-GTPase-TBC domain